MGGKRVGQRQYFYFFLALLIYLPGCSLIQDSNRDEEMHEALAAGNDLLARGDFDKSIAMYQSVLTIAQDKPPADVANFHMGLVHAHPENPNRNLQKAMASFSHVVSGYPGSPWAEHARVWMGVLREAQTARRDLEKSRRAIERSNEVIEKNRMALEKSRQEIEKSRAELEKTRQEIEKSRQVIERSKQVDIEIDQKRRERGR